MRQLLQHSIAGQAGDITEVGLSLDPRPHLGVGQVAVPAQDDAGIGPGVAQGLAQPFQHREELRRAEALSLEDRGNQAS